jgi:hypothetical protein
MITDSQKGSMTAHRRQYSQNAAQNYEVQQVTNPAIQSYDKRGRNTKG